MILDLLAIQIIVTLIIYYTGAIDNMLTPIVKWITKSKVGHIGPPLGCSKCSMWWCGLAYLLITHQFGFWSLVLTLVLACTTDLTLALFLLLKDFVSAFIDTFTKYFIR